MTTQEIKKAEYEMDILMGGGVVRPASSRYEEYAEKRISLMKSYAKNEMSRHSYLIAIGGQTWKQSHDVVLIRNNTCLFCLDLALYSQLA